MGYSYSAIDRIIDNPSLFKDKKILTLGTLYPYLKNNESDLLAKRGVSKTVSNETFSKHLFVDLLGAKVCHSLDVSDYQQSEIICNLNFPLPDELIAQYDVIIDAGTLEHLSNLSIALSNLFKLLKDNGVYYFGVPCNNWIDHGFFQFSPTFFIDMCIDNPNLHLSDLHLSTTKKVYYYSAINPFFKHALYTSCKRINVGGVIKKTNGNIDLNLTQSKYRQQYIDKTPATSDDQINRGIIKTLVRKVILWFSASSLFPLQIKELVLNQLYKLK
jgi:SAM-dependent methyltransferase